MLKVCSLHFLLTIRYTVETYKKLFYYLTVLPLWSNSSKIPKKEFFFSKVAGLQTATLLKDKVLHKYFSGTLITEKGQLFCRNTSVWLLPLQTETQKKTSNSAQLTLKNG